MWRADTASQSHLLGTSRQAAKGVIPGDSPFGSGLERAYATVGRVGPLPGKIIVFITLITVNEEDLKWEMGIHTRLQLWSFLVHAH